MNYEERIKSLRDTVIGLRAQLVEQEQTLKTGKISIDDFEKSIEKIRREMTARYHEIKRLHKQLVEQMKRDQDGDNPN